MKLEMTGQMRMEQRMKLAPHMIQSMEILQLPILALQERIEQELNSNPVLEMEEPAGSDDVEPTDEASSDDDMAEKDLVVEADESQADDFERLESIDEEYKEFLNQSGPYRKSAPSEEKDRKLEALKNTAALPQSLGDYLDEQWGLVEVEEPVRQAGRRIIDYIDSRGYLSVPLEQLHNKDRKDFGPDDLKEALAGIQQLDPPGVGARNIRECFLIQITQSPEDMSFEYRLVSDHMDALLENRLPEIAKKMECPLERVNRAIERLSKFDTSPGLQIGRDENIRITPDVIVESDDDTEEFHVRLAESDLPGLTLNRYYTDMAKDNHVGAGAKKFLQNNIRSAHWIIEAIQQRRNTLLRVAQAIVKYQQDFFEQGPLLLHPLPMSKVADDVGVHLATVSRAVSGKYLQCAWGVLPLRKFFSGGTEDSNGESHSWEAIRAKLQQIIDEEDKSDPLNDDEILKKLLDAGVPKLARRTVAKYRKLMNIPTARFRKRY